MTSTDALDLESPRLLAVEDVSCLYLTHRIRKNERGKSQPQKQPRGGPNTGENEASHIGI